DGIRDFHVTGVQTCALPISDGHAKNFSLAIEPGGYFRLAPLYDVLSAWPWVGTKQNQCPIQRVKMAMALRTSNTRYKMQEVLLKIGRASCREKAKGGEVVEA